MSEAQLPVNLCQIHIALNIISIITVAVKEACLCT